MEHIEDFQKLDIRVKDIREEHRIDLFIRTLKDNIQHEVRLSELDSLEKAFRLARKMESKIMTTRKPTTHNYKDGSVVSPSLPQPTRLTTQQLEEKRAKGLCYKVESKIMATRKSTPHNYKDGSVVSPSLPQPTRFTPQQLEEKREKGFCYNCDNKYIKGHKCAEKKLFYIDCGEEEEKDQETSKEEDIH